MNNAKEYIKLKHNGEIPYKYGADECATLMEEYAKNYHYAELKKLRLSTVLDRKKELFDFIEYCNNAGWIKNVDKKRIIEDYEKSISKFDI